MPSSHRTSSAASPLATRAARVTAFATLALTLVAGCSKKQENAYVPPPPPEVTVANPVLQEVTDYWFFSGNTAAIETVDIRPRVSGYVEDILFKPDSIVEKDQPLFQIDPRPFKLRVAQAEAEVATRQAELVLADVTVQKLRKIAPTGAASDIELRQAEAQYLRSQAQVDLARSALDSAKLDLDWSTVKSPIKGRISRNLVDRGALVSADGTQPLARVNNDDSLYAYFEASESQHLEFMRRYPQSRTETGDARNELMPVEMGLADEDGKYPHTGRIDWADNAIDERTGTIRVRAIIPNPDKLITPGLFARIRMSKGSKTPAALVPEVAVAEDQGGRYVLVVDDKNKVERRPVQVGPLLGSKRAVVAGLKGDEWVVVNGIQRARPGAEVKPVKAPPDKASSENAAADPAPTNPQAAALAVHPVMPTAGPKASATKPSESTAGQ